MKRIKAALYVRRQGIGGHASSTWTIGGAMAKELELSEQTLRTGIKGAEANEFM